MKHKVPRPERFWAKALIDQPDECWKWIGYMDRHGYGRWNDMLAHRVAYELERGPIAPGMTIDHLCRNRACVNPIHMEVVTPLENTRRGFGVGMIASRKQFCLRGHEFDKVRPRKGKNPQRVCLRCDVIRQRNWKLHRKALDQA